jgi:Mg2+-importing ATPase
MTSTVLTGLSSFEAKKFIGTYGRNEIPRKKESVVWQFLGRFRNPLVLILLGAAAVSAFSGDDASAGIIIVIVLFSGGLDFINSFRASKAAEKLQEKVKITASVIRDGHAKEIPVSLIVPGDVVLLSPGDVVPADGSMLDPVDFFVSESALTGESFPVEKAPNDKAFMGSSVTTGTGKMKVEATGALTRFGGIAAALNAKDMPTEFDRGIASFSRLVVSVMFVLVIFVFVVHAFAHHGILESLLFAAALAVGLTPELLPMIITLNLTKGSLAMAEHGVIVKRLSAIQNCGSMDVLCTDKTGTLTEDRIELVKYVDAAGHDSDDVLFYAYLNSIHRSGRKNPLDASIKEFKHIDTAGWRKIEEIPFDYERKRDSIVVAHEDGHILISKGEPEELAKVSHGWTDQAKKEYVKLSSDGFRVLAVSIKKLPPSKNVYTKIDEKDMSFLGFVAFFDPPKKTAEESLKMLEAHGIEIKIITGDNELVTEKIARDISLPSKGTILGVDLAKLSKAEISKAVEANTIFARVSPDQKMHIIKALQKNGHGVGYLGDGINDAPSLKAADVGISVENAVDVAKESADFILMKKSLHDLIEGVVEGRKTFVNTFKYLMMSLSGNFGNMLSMAGASLFIPFFPLLPTQILLNNLLYDGSQFAIPLDNVDKEDVKVPRKFDIKFLKRFMLVFGPLSSAFDVITFVVLLSVFHFVGAQFQTGWFLESMATQLLVVFIIRTRKAPFSESRPSKILFASIILVLVIGWMIAIMPVGAIFGFAPISFSAIAFAFVISIVYLAVAEMGKKVFYKRLVK